MLNSLLHSQLHTDIRRALFGTGTILSTSLLSVLSTTTAQASNHNTLDNDIHYFELNKTVAKQHKQAFKTKQVNSSESAEHKKSNLNPQKKPDKIKVDSRSSNYTTPIDSTLNVGVTQNIPQNIKTQQPTITKTNNPHPSKLQDSSRQLITNKHTDEFLSQKAEEIELLKNKVNEEKEAYDRLSLELSAISKRASSTSTDSQKPFSSVIEPTFDTSNSTTQENISYKNSLESAENSLKTNYSTDTGLDNPHNEQAYTTEEPFSDSLFASYLVPNVTTEAASYNSPPPVISNNQPITGNELKSDNSKEIELTNKLVETAYEFYPPSEVQSSSENLGEKFTNWFVNFPNDQSNTANLHHDAVTSVNKDDSTEPKRCIGQWVYPKSALPSSEITDTGKPIISTQSGEIVPEGGFYATADYAYSDNVNYAELQGNAVFQQGQQQITAERILVDLKTRTTQAEGQVMFTDATNTQLADSNIDKAQTSQMSNIKSGGLIGIADNISYNSDNKTAQANDVAFASIPMQAHGFAKKMTKDSDSEYNLQEVIFSTCPPTDRTWQIESRNIDLNTDTGRGETYNTTLKIKNIPVMYLPYFNFPIDGRRTTGFLVPKASLNSETGFEVSIPYYLNLAPNYDATLTTRVFTDRNPMLTGEFRYLTDGYGQGRMVGSFLPKDKEFNDKNRSSFFYEHNWQSEKIAHLTADAQYNHVSDSKYNDDFDYLGVVENDLNLPRNININYYNKYLDAQFKAESFQRLDAVDNRGSRIQDKDRPYDRLPQITLNYELPKLSEWSHLNSTDNQLTNFDLDNVKITGSHDSAYFRKSITDGSTVEQSGFRMYNKLSASYPYGRPWGYIEPKISLQHLFTTYNEDARQANNVSEEDNSQSVFVPQFSIDAMAHFEKKGAPVDWFGKNDGGYQLISPRLKYTYAPYKSQNDIPNFNTRIASINYDQLFSDSWFLGYDRLQDLHAITPGVNYRYIDESGLTRLDANIAQQYYLDSGQVTLNDASNSNTQSTALFDDSSSGVVASISAQPYNNFWVDINGATKNNYDLSYFTGQLRYQPTTNSQFSFGVIERKKDENTNQLPLSALTTSAIFPINDNWRVISQTQYDYEDSRFLDTLFGVDYEDCCIGFSVYGRRYYNDLNLNDEPNEAIMGELRLKGITSHGGQLSRLLSEKILGIRSVNSAWKRASY